MAFVDIKPYVDNPYTVLDMDIVNGVSTSEDAGPAWTASDKEAFVRGFRDEWLRNSDWTVGNDSPLSEEVRNSWITYRQALRDMMAVASIDDIVVPTPPDIRIIIPNYVEPA